MTKYPLLPAREIINALKRLGFEVVRQKGSHVKLCKRSGNRKITTIVPNHKSVMAGTLKGVLELAEITLNDFLSSL